MSQIKSIAYGGGVRQKFTTPVDGSSTGILNDWRRRADRFMGVVPETNGSHGVQ